MSVPLPSLHLPPPLLPLSFLLPLLNPPPSFLHLYLHPPPPSPHHQENISQMCVEIHTSVSSMADVFYTEFRRHYYTTPTSYLELINQYSSMRNNKWGRPLCVCVCVCEGVDV